MHDPRERDERTAEALAALDLFTTRLLRSQLWRSSRCRDRPLRVRKDWLDDLRQELAVDCLSRVDEVLATSTRERHQHWFRFVERWLYRESRQGSLARVEHEPAARPESPEPAAALWSAATGRRELVGQALASGRPNITATAATNGLPRRQVRELWTRVAERAGFDAEFLAFWRRRLAEALLGLAADLLLDRGLVRVLPGPRSRPDPRRRMRRIRRILRVLAVRPIPHELRTAIATAHLRCGARSSRPHDLLLAAVRLDPGNAAALLWQFESFVAGGDLRGAASSLWTARRHGADPVATALARARLLGRRGRGDAAAALLRRLGRRHPLDPRPAAALRAATPSIRYFSACASDSASCSSSPGSGRGDDQDGIEANQPKPR